MTWQAWILSGMSLMAVGIGYDVLPATVLGAFIFAGELLSLAEQR